MAIRLLMRRILIVIYNRGRMRSRVLIYGGGQTVVQLASALGTDDTFDPIAFIDDNPTLQKIFVDGLPVMSPLQIESIIRDMRIDRIVLAMPSSRRTNQFRPSRQLQSTKCAGSNLPSFTSLIRQGPLKDGIETLDSSEDLGRDGVDKDLLGENDIYGGGRVLVTGAGTGRDIKHVGSEDCVHRLIAMAGVQSKKIRPH